MYATANTITACKWYMAILHICRFVCTFMIMPRINLAVMLEHFQANTTCHRRMQLRRKQWPIVAVVACNGMQAETFVNMHVNNRMMSAQKDFI